jgi:hypothetical protein
MGRWVRWFGSEEGAQGAPVATAPSPQAAASGRVVTVSGSRAREVARFGKMAIAPAPTGQISVATLPAEMLTGLLVEEGAISREDEYTCLQEHRTTGRPVEDIICDSELMAESELMSILSRRCKVPHLSLENYQIRPQVLESVPADFARANNIMPLERLGRVLNVATSNPLNFAVFKRLEEEAGVKVKPVLATPRELRECIDEHFPAPEAEEPEATKESFRVSMKDVLKDSWLGSIEKGQDPEEMAAEEDESPEAAEGYGGSPEPSDDSRPIPLSEDEADAFVKTSSTMLLEDWAASVGAGGERLAALPVAEPQFMILAADEPAPPSGRMAASSGEGPSAGSRKGDSSVTGWWRAFRKPPDRAAKPKKAAAPAKDSKPATARKKSRKKRKKKSGR